MRNKVLTGVLALGIATTAITTTNNLVTRDSDMTVYVSEVYDGDTFYINLDGVPSVFGERIPVRVNGIDTPELRTKNLQEKEIGYKAKAYAESLILHRRVTLVNPQRDKYFRILADVTLPTGENFEQKMLDSGLAREYHGEHKDVWDSTTD